MFSEFDDKGEPGANFLSHDGARQEADGAGTHRQCGPFPGISRGIATGRLFKSLSRTVACSRELISIYIFVIEGWT